MEKCWKLKGQKVKVTWPKVQLRHYQP